MQRFLNRNVFLPLSDLYNDLSISSCYSFLLKSQFWSQDEHLNYQLDHLHKLIRHIYDNVPFYKLWFNQNQLQPEDIKSFDDLKKLPVVDKNLIRKNPKLFIAENLPFKKMIRLNSSGSTGEPFEYFMSRNAYSMKYAAALRGWSWMGYKPGDRYAKLSQNERSSGLKRIQDIVNRCDYIYIPDLSRAGLSKVIEGLKKAKPLFIRCYPDPLYFMAKILMETNQKLDGIIGINSTGNILNKESRSLIEEWFNAPLFDSYSCEGSALFYEGPTRETYLGSMESAITEVLDSGYSDAEPGQTGIHVTTDLHNYAMPLVRYNTQDLVERSDIKSSCGRNLFSIKRIIGRDNDILITPSGNLLIVHLFTIYFEYFTSVLQFQIEQTGTHEFVFRLMVDDKFESSVKDQILTYWKNFIGGNVNIIVEIHDKIPLLNSGKRRFLIRNPDIKIVI